MANAPKKSKPNTAQAATKRKAAKLKKRRQRRALLFSTVFLLLAVALLIWAISLLKKRPGGGGTPVEATQAPGASSGMFASDSRYPEGTMVNGISIGGKTADEARALLTNGLELQLRNYRVTLENETIGTKVLYAEDLGLSFDVDAILVQAQSGGVINVHPTVNRDTLRNSLYAINDTLSNHAENATVDVEYDSYSVGKVKYTKPKFVYTAGKAGQQLDCDAVISQVEEAISSGETSAVISPEIIISEPAVTVETLKKQRTKLATFTTTYYFDGTKSTSEAELENRRARDVNISKAVGLMNYIVVYSGQSFSFNDATGRRSEENGWAYAKAVYQGGYRAETGGGVCQVSTTMFNALVRAGVTITKHQEHTIPSDYVDVGWDATVDYGHIDFKFKNNKDDPIYIFIYITKNKGSSRKKDIVVEVYGPEEPNVTYKTRDEIVETDPAVNPTTKPDKSQYTDYSSVIQNPHDGYTVNIFVDKYVDGVYVETTFQYTAIYKKIEQVTLVGTKPTPTPVPTKTPRPTATPKSAPSYDDNPYISY